MGKIINTSFEPVTSYNAISQTPPNLVTDNYYLQSLQDKVNADWDFRYNRVIVEEERPFASGQYQELEVVIQSVRNDKGVKVSDDIRRLVFRDITYDVQIGAKFKFAYNFKIDQPEQDKNIWLVTNKDSTSPTAQVVISRCNGTLGSLYKDEKGEVQKHYEPVICTTDLQAANLYYNNTIITPQAQVVLIVQYNEYTKNYFLNQRFIVGYDKVYKVKGINNFNSLHTNNPLDVGTIMLYVDLDEKSAKDNFTDRIAFNEDGEEQNIPDITLPEDQDYSIKCISPEVLPNEANTQGTEFQFAIYQGEQQVPSTFTFSYVLENTEMLPNYVKIEEKNGDSIFIQKIRNYNRGELKVNCVGIPTDAPDGTELSYSFSLSLRGL